jgi:hypothetical protein
MIDHIGNGVDNILVAACIAIPSRRHIAVAQKGMVGQPGFALLDACRPRRLVADFGSAHSPHAMTKLAGMVKDCFTCLGVASSRSRIRRQHSRNKNECCNDFFHANPRFNDHIAIASAQSVGRREKWRHACGMIRFHRERGIRLHPLR